jgi:predicted permease
MLYSPKCEINKENIVSELFLCSIKSVATIILASLPGFLLVRFKILNGESLRLIGKIVVYAALPALLATKLADSISLDTLSDLWIFPVSAAISIFGAYGIARFANLFLKEKSEFKGVLYTASALGNAAYLPIPLIVAICAVFPYFSDKPDAAAKGITFISAFIVAFSPLSWIFGYNTISAKDHKIELKYFFPPPVIGIIIGMLIGMTPFLKNLFCTSDGFFYPLFESWRIVSAAAIPLAMIVLGGRFALPPQKASIPNKLITAVATIKLFILPSVAIGYVFLLRYWGIINNDPMIALIIIIEAAVPPANNLILMASMHKVNEHATAKTLFICYTISTVTLTLFITLAMAIF